MLSPCENRGGVIYNSIDMKNGNEHHKLHRVETWVCKIVIWDESLRGKVYPSQQVCDDLSFEDDVEEEGEVEAEAGPTERSSYEVEFGQKSNQECELCQNKMGRKGPQHQSFWNILLCIVCIDIVCIDILCISFKSS